MKEEKNHTDQKEKEEEVLPVSNSLVLAPGISLPLPAPSPLSSLIPPPFSRAVSCSLSPDLFSYTQRPPVGTVKEWALPPQDPETSVYLPKLGVVEPNESRVLLRRGKQRWCQLLTATSSRIGIVMRPVLGHDLWTKFVNYASENFKDQFLAAFRFPIICCGRIDGTPCPQKLQISCDSDLQQRKGNILGHFHLDHDVELMNILEIWTQVHRRQAGQAHQVSWDSGIDKKKLCHLLFGVSQRGLSPAKPSLSVREL